MRPIPSEHRPSVAVAAGLVLLLAGFVRLGFWQLDRAEQKRALYRAFETGGASGAVALTLDDTVTLAEDRYRTLEVRGEYLPDRQFLLDAMTHAGRAGYEVLTPFRPSRGRRWLLVNRGWIEASPDRSVLPELAIETPSTTLRGRIDALPVPGIRLGGSESGADGWPRVALFPTVAELQDMLGVELAGFQLLLDPDADDGYVRDWQPPPMPPATHVGYAVQWFGLAGAVAVAGLILLRRELARHKP